MLFRLVRFNGSLFKLSFAFLLVVLFPWHAASATTATTELISVNSAGTASANAGSERPDVSDDERFVAFISQATDLTSLSTTGHGQCYVRDAVDGTTAMVSTNAAGTAGGNGNCYQPIISANGRFVAFYDDGSDLVANDTNGTSDAFVRDLVTGTTILVSINSAGTASSNGASFPTSISADGRYVVFQSNASDLSPFDTAFQEDVFVRDLVAATTTVASVNASGTSSGNADSQNGVISADGTTVAFESTATDLVSTDTNGMVDVYARNLVTGTNVLVSTNVGGTDSGNGPATVPSISADGRYVAFQSQSTNLVTTDTNGVRDVFERDLVGGTTELVSVNTTGTDSGNNTASAASINRDGSVVVFQSAASNLVTTDTNGAIDVFAWYRNGSATRLASANTGNTNSGNAISNVPSVSPSGFFAGFQSLASDLATIDGNAVSDIFVRNLGGGTSVASINSSGTNSGNATSPSLSFSRVTDDGSIAFDSGAFDLVANDANGSPDVFLRTIYEFHDDFEDNSVPDWTLSGTGTLNASSGKMHVTTAKKVDVLSPFSGFSDTVLADVTFTSAGAKLFLDNWYIDKSNRVELKILPDKNKWLLKVFSGGQAVAKKTAKNVSTQIGRKHVVTLLYTGFHPTATFQVLVDGVKVIDLDSGLSTFSPTGDLRMQLKSSTHADVGCDFGGFETQFTD